MSKKVHRGIVKVQMSLFSSDDIPSVMVYNESRDFMYEDTPTKDIVEIMDGEPKKYFNATWKNKGNIVLNEEVEEQNW